MWDPTSKLRRGPTGLSSTSFDRETECAINPQSQSGRLLPGTLRQWVWSGAKSDPSDAKVLADAVRTDRHIHRLITGETSTRSMSLRFPVRQSASRRADLLR